MFSTRQINSCIEACTSRSLKENLIAMEDTLEDIRNGLHAFLEKKRFNYPRFNFLSDEEMLDILSHSGYP